MKIAKGIYLKSLSSWKIFMKMIKWFRVYFLITSLAKCLFRKNMNEKKYKELCIFVEAWKYAQRLSVAVLFPVCCIIMVFIEHLAQVYCKNESKASFSLFLVWFISGCFNSQCTLETTSLEISVYCLYPIYHGLFMFRFKSFWKLWWISPTPTRDLNTINEWIWSIRLFEILRYV